MNPKIVAIQCQLARCLWLCVTARARLAFDTCKHLASLEYWNILGKIMKNPFRSKGPLKLYAQILIPDVTESFLGADGGVPWVLGVLGVGILASLGAQPWRPWRPWFTQIQWQLRWLPTWRSLCGGSASSAGSMDTPQAKIIERDQADQTAGKSTGCEGGEWPGRVFRFVWMFLNVSEWFQEQPSEVNWLFTLWVISETSDQFAIEMKPLPH